MLSIFTYLAQFGGGFEPPVTNSFTDQATTSPTSNLENILSNAIGFITILAGIFFIFQIVTAAFSMVTAGGDSGKLNTARDKMLQAVLGLVIVVGAYAIVGLLGSVVGLDILNPGQEILDNIVP